MGGLELKYDQNCSEIVRFKMSSSERQPGNGVVIAKELQGEFTWASGDRVGDQYFCSESSSVCIYLQSLP